MAGRLEKSTNLSEVWGVIGQRCTEYAAPPEQPSPPEPIRPPGAEQPTCAWRPGTPYVFVKKPVCVTNYDFTISCYFTSSNYSGITESGTYIVSAYLYINGERASGLNEHLCAGTPPPILPYRV